MKQIIYFSLLLTVFYFHPLMAANTTTYSINTSQADIQGLSHQEVVSALTSNSMNNPVFQHIVSSLSKGQLIDVFNDSSFMNKPTTNAQSGPLHLKTFGNLVSFSRIDSTLLKSVNQDPRLTQEGVKNFKDSLESVSPNINPEYQFPNSSAPGRYY